jgi:cytochrome P450
MTAANSVTDLPAMSVDFKAPSFVADPYPALEEVRAAGPVVYHPELDFYMVSGYRECARVMGLAKYFASDVEHFIELFGGATMECMDNPRHDQVKSIWAKDFQRSTIGQQRDLISSIVDADMSPIIERLRSGEEVDAVTAFTRAIPTIIIAELMGVDREHFPRFAQWSDDMGGILEARDDGSEEGRALTERAKRATIELNEYIAHEVGVRRRRGTGDDLVSKMANSDVPMADDEVVASNTQLVFAGNETTSKLMGYVLLALAQHPDQRDQIRMDRSLLPQAIEEVHRWTSVLVYNLRFVKEAGTAVAGISLPEGATVMALQAAANRDPERWENPSLLDIHRAPQAHLGFGAGLHSCLGLNLARIETEVLVNKLLDEVPDWGVTDVAWGSNPMVRGASHITMTDGR